MFSNHNPPEKGSAGTSAAAHQQWQQGNATSSGFFGTTLVHRPVTAGGQFANNYPNAVNAHAKNAPSVLAPTVTSSNERATTVESVHEALEIQILRDQKTGRLGSLPPSASSTTSSSATSLYSKNVATKNRTTGGASAAASLVVGGAQRGSYFDLQQQGQHHEIDHTTETVTSPLYRLSDIRVSGPIPTALILLATEHGPPGVFFHRNTGVASVAIQVTDDSQGFFPFLSRVSAFHVTWEARARDAGLKTNLPAGANSTSAGRLNGSSSSGGGRQIMNASKNVVGGAAAIPAIPPKKLIEEHLPMVFVGQILVLRDCKSEIKKPRFCKLTAGSYRVLSPVEEQEILRNEESTASAPLNANTSRSLFTSQELHRIRELIAYRGCVLRNSKDSVHAVYGYLRDDDIYASLKKTAANMFRLRLLTRRKSSKSSRCLGLLQKTSQGENRPQHERNVKQQQTNITRSKLIDIKSRHENNDFFLLKNLDRASRTGAVVRVVVNNSNSGGSGSDKINALQTDLVLSSRQCQAVDTVFQSTTDRVTLVHPDFFCAQQEQQNNLRSYRNEQLQLHHDENHAPHQIVNSSEGVKMVDSEEKNGNKTFFLQAEIVSQFGGGTSCNAFFSSSRGSGSSVAAAPTGALSMSVRDFKTFLRRKYFQPAVDASDCLVAKIQEQLRKRKIQGRSQRSQAPAYGQQENEMSHLGEDVEMKAAIDAGNNVVENGRGGSCRVDDPTSSYDPTARTASNDSSSCSSQHQYIIVNYDECTFLGGGRVELPPYEQQARTRPGSSSNISTFFASTANSSTERPKLFAEHGRVDHFYVAAWELRTSRNPKTLHKSGVPPNQEASGGPSSSACSGSAGKTNLDQLGQDENSIIVYSDELEDMLAPLFEDDEEFALMCTTSMPPAAGMNHGSSSCAGGSSSVIFEKAMERLFQPEVVPLPEADLQKDPNRQQDGTRLQCPRGPVGTRNHDQPQQLPPSSCVVGNINSFSVVQQHDRSISSANCEVNSTTSNGTSSKATSKSNATPSRGTSNRAASLFPGKGTVCVSLGMDGRSVPGPHAIPLGETIFRNAYKITLTEIFERGTQTELAMKFTDVDDHHHHGRTHLEDASAAENYHDKADEAEADVIMQD
ncbi:unnamed protein product [Amoebophrya sp. A120]|nr:unnamed protein product [Amoebophrya sp. A120]|eukprot:GSA120T00009598001.1